MNQLYRQSGFTLIELLVVISITAVLLMKGVPAVQALVTNSRLNSAAQALQTTAQLARNEAIRRNETVRLRSSGATLEVLRNPGAADQEVLREVALPTGATTPVFTLDYASSGLTVPFGSEVQVSVAQGISGCGDDVRCPSVFLGAGGLTRICPKGACQ